MKWFIMSLCVFFSCSEEALAPKRFQTDEDLREQYLMEAMTIASHGDVYHKSFCTSEMDICEDFGEQG